MKNENVAEYMPQPIPLWLKTVLDPKRLNTIYPYGRTFKCHGSGFIPVDEKD